MYRKTFTSIGFSVFTGILAILYSCETFNPSGPELILSDSLSTGSILLAPGENFTFAWTATKGDADLSTFSIEKEGSMLEGWDEFEIPSSESDFYAGEASTVVPSVEGNYEYLFTVADSNELTATKSLNVEVSKAAILVPDALIYYKDSEFLFVIKDGLSDVKTTLMTWTVSDFDETNKVATISNVLDDETTGIPLPSTFYFRKSGNGVLEYSKDKSSWKMLTDLFGDVNFLFGTKAAKPSSLLGSVKNGVEITSVTYPDGNSLGVRVSSEYDNSGNDNYTYSDYIHETYSEDVGFVKSTQFVSDGSIFPFWTYKREVELAYYVIQYPDGSSLEGGSSTPVAPSDLTASYTYKDRVYIFDSPYSGHYETRSYVTLRWTDNSDNETHFEVYISTDDINYEHLSHLEDSPLDYEDFAANSTRGKIKRGYYVTWPDATYYFKLKAVSAVGESEFSNVASISAK